MKDERKTKKQLIAELETSETQRLSAKQAGKQAEGGALNQSAVLEAINKVLLETLACETDVEVARTCLAVAEELTGSKFGFIGEVNQAGLFDTIALSNPGWDNCRMPRSDAVVMIKGMEIHGIWGRVLKDEQSLIVNDPASYPHRVGTPEGHPPLTSFLGIPLKQEGQTIGLIGLANKESGYDLADQQAVETLSVAFVEALMRKRVEETLKESEKKYRRLYEKMKDMAQKDPLTGLFNHGRINELLEHEIERSKRGSYFFSIMMLDVDDLKLINDTYGHIIGDRLLKNVASLLKSTCRSIDLIGRYAGDEFLIVLPYSDGEKAKSLAERIARRMRQKGLKVDEKTNIPIRLSIGAATYPYDSMISRELVALADRSMYESKRSGKSVVSATVPEVAEFLSTKTLSLGILEGVVAVVNSKDHYTKAHSDLVTKFSLSLGKEVNLPQEQMKALEIAGLLHDIGKIGIPETILRKPGPLKTEEFEIIKQHPGLGVTMLNPPPHREHVLGAIMYHHERYDGKGYPRRLKGEDIPFLARIIAIADAYCAMITDRPYRKALTKDEAIEELKKNAGTQFDPDLVSKFIELECLKENES